MSKSDETAIEKRIRSCCDRNGVVSYVEAVEIAQALGYTFPLSLEGGILNTPVGSFRFMAAGDLQLAGRLPEDAGARKDIPMARGLLDYFPDALAEVAAVSKAGNDQHNPGQDMHWARTKSTDHADCIIRHLVDRGKQDRKGIRHTAMAAWRALALLQIELEEARGLPPPRGAGE